MSQKIYCIAEFRAKEGKDEALFEVLKALEPDTLREDGCIQYVTTRRMPSRFAEGTSYGIVLNEIWEDRYAFEAHCVRKAIVAFFEEQCASPEGLVSDYNVCIYTDEPVDYDAPK